jgi:hypothetical protein
VLEYVCRLTHVDALHTRKELPKPSSAQRPPREAETEYKALAKSDAVLSGIPERSVHVPALTAGSE